MNDYPIPMKRAAVLLDPHPFCHEAVESLLSGLGIAVAAKATSTDVALALLEKHKPDLFVMEIDVPGGMIDGLTCLRQASERVPNVTTIVLSANGDPRRVEAALAAGAAAYVLKAAQPEDIAVAIRQAFEHSVYLAGSIRDRFGPHVSRGLRSTSVPEAHTGRGTPNGSSPRLTPRELEVLRLVAEGRSNRQVAKLLWVTNQTVKFHLANVYRKLGVCSRTEAARWARASGLLPPMSDPEVAREEVAAGRPGLLLSGTEG